MSVPEVGSQPAEDRVPMHLLHSRVARLPSTSPIKVKTPASTCMDSQHLQYPVIPTPSSPHATYNRRKGNRLTPRGTAPPKRRRPTNLRPTRTPRRGNPIRQRVHPPTQPPTRYTIEAKRLQRSPSRVVCQPFGQSRVSLHPCTSLLSPRSRISLVGVALRGPRSPLPQGEG